MSRKLSHEFEMHRVPIDVSGDYENLSKVVSRLNCPKLNPYARDRNIKLLIQQRSKEKRNQSSNLVRSRNTLTGVSSLQPAKTNGRVSATFSYFSSFTAVSLFVRPRAGQRFLSKDNCMFTLSKYKDRYEAAEPGPPRNLNYLEHERNSGAEEDAATKTWWMCIRSR